MHIFLRTLFILFFISPAYAIPDVYTAQNFQGVNMHELMETWGEPDLKIMNPDGSSVLIYEVVTSRVYNAPTPGVGVNVAGSRPVIIVNNANQSMPYNQTNLSLKCLVKFNTNKHGTIIKVRMNGNACS